jgi:hypothetical protein
MSRFHGVLHSSVFCSLHESSWQKIGPMSSWTLSEDLLPDPTKIPQKTVVPQNRAIVYPQISQRIRGADCEEGSKHAYCTVAGVASAVALSGGNMPTSALLKAAYATSRSCCMRGKASIGMRGMGIVPTRPSQVPQNPSGSSLLPHVPQLLLSTCKAKH